MGARRLLAEEATQPNPDIWHEVKAQAVLLAEEATQPNPDLDRGVVVNDKLLAEEATQPNPDSRLRLTTDHIASSRRSDAAKPGQNHLF